MAPSPPQIEQLKAVVRVSRRSSYAPIGMKRRHGRQDALAMQKPGA
jgi:hypothetical protein